MPASAATTIPAKSVAVLLFVNMSSDKKQDYFSTGLSDELLNQLAQLPQLRVIARTSSFSFKGKQLDVATIARALNVANLLQGSVSKEGNTLRITAQLLRPPDSSELWSQTCDRQLTDVFRIQDDMSGQVVVALELKLLPAQLLLGTGRADNMQACNHYLRAGQLMAVHTLEAWQQAIVEYHSAVDDPRFPACCGRVGLPTTSAAVALPGVLNPTAWPSSKPQYAAGRGAEEDAAAVCAEGFVYAAAA